MNFHQLKDIYKGKKILITGHTGFKGSWLTQVLLMLGAEVAGVSLSPRTRRDIFVSTGLQKKIRHMIADICNYDQMKELLQEVRPDVVFHLAAQPLVRESYDSPLATILTNTVGTANVLEAVRQVLSVKAVVIVTTDKVYENKEIKYGYCETDSLGGYDPYSGSKAAADIITQSYLRSFFNPAQYGVTHKTLVAIARAGNVIGGGDWAPDRLVPDIMRAVFDGDGVITLRNPDAVRPWEHVLEPISGYLALGARLLVGDIQMAGPWNFGPQASSWVSVGEVANILLEQLGEGTLQIEADSSKHEAGLLMLDVTKVHRELSWRSRWSIEKTMYATAEWYREVVADPEVAEAITFRQIREYFTEE